MKNDAEQPENTAPTSSAPQAKKGSFNLSFRLQDNTKLPLMFGVGCLAVLAFSFFDARARLSFTIPLLTAVAGITGFLYTQHARDIQLFRELFREFNERYGALNNRLNEICDSRRVLTDPDRRVLCAYFDLCAEEYMYFTAGHIDSGVWDAWIEGMRYFDEDHRIRESAYALYSSIHNWS
jgi:hypothetical protein